MPIYCYRCPDGHLSEIFEFSPGAKPGIKCNYCGKPAKRSLSDEQVNTDCVSRERWSDAMGINPDQIADFRKAYPDSVYDNEGRLLVKSRAHKKKLMKERGYVEL